MFKEPETFWRGVTKDSVKNSNNNIKQKAKLKDTIPDKEQQGK
jgi:hypothetical protein